MQSPLARSSSYWPTALAARPLDLQRGARNLWVLLIVGLAVHAWCLPYAHSVFDIYLGAARRWLAGDDLYIRARDYYRYSPLFAVSLTPLAVTGDRLAAALWKLLNCGVYLAGLIAWTRRLGSVHQTREQQAAVWLLAIPLSLHSMYNSQANLMMLGSLLLGLAAAAEGRWNRSAAWLASATLIKGYPLGLAMILAGLYPRRFTPRYLLALAAGLLLPFAAGRPSLVLAQYQSWLHHLRDSAEIMRERLRSIDQLFVVAGSPISEQTFSLVGAVGGALVFVVCLWIARRGGDRRQTLTWVFLWFSAWVVLCGPATESCTYVVAAPAIGWAVVEAWRRRAAWPWRVALIASLLMMGPAVTDMFGKLIRNFANEHGSQPLGALILLAWLATETYRWGVTDTARPAAECKQSAPLAGIAHGEPA